MNYCDVCVPASFLEELIIEGLKGRTATGVSLNVDVLRPCETFIYQDWNTCEMQLEELRLSTDGSVLTAHEVSPEVSLHYLTHTGGPHSLLAKMYLDSTPKNISACVLNVKGGAEDLKGRALDVNITARLCLKPDHLRQLMIDAFRKGDLQDGDVFCFKRASGRSKLPSFQKCIPETHFGDMQRVISYPKYHLEDSAFIWMCTTLQDRKKLPFLAERLLFDDTKACVTWMHLKIDREERRKRQRLSTQESTAPTVPNLGPVGDLLRMPVGDMPVGDILVFIREQDRLPNKTSQCPREKALFKRFAQLIEQYHGDWTENPLEFLLSPDNHFSKHVRAQILTRVNR